jgi:large subunit ribosomal protein LP2
MKHIAAYALLVLGGKAKPTAADIEKVLKEAGVAADEGKSAAIVAACEGKDFHELVQEGMKAMKNMGGAPVAASAAKTNAPAAKVEEVEEEADVDMGDLFGGDY